jgi:hypothetical protein
MSNWSKKNSNTLVPHWIGGAGTMGEQEQCQHCFLPQLLKQRPHLLVRVVGVRIRNNESKEKEIIWRGWIRGPRLLHLRQFDGMKDLVPALTNRQILNIWFSPRRHFSHLGCRAVDLTLDSRSRVYYIVQTIYVLLLHITYTFKTIW